MRRPLSRWTRGGSERQPRLAPRSGFGRAQRSTGTLPTRAPDAGRSTAAVYRHLDWRHGGGPGGDPDPPPPAHTRRDGGRDQDGIDPCGINGIGEPGNEGGPALFAGPPPRPVSGHSAAYGRDRVPGPEPQQRCGQPLRPGCWWADLLRRGLAYARPRSCVRTQPPRPEDTCLTTPSVGRSYLTKT
jgi:hypothetical protein